MWASMPTLAAAPASEEAAFPVEEQVMTDAPASIAFATPTVEARSLSEAVGFTPSSLMSSSRSPRSLANRRAL